MLKIKEVSRMSGISIRTLQYYDKIGLLHPAAYSESGYRLYDTDSIKKLQQILLFRELEFPLKDIRKIMDNPEFNSEKALSQQIELLKLKKEHLENLISFACEIKALGEYKMDFSAFDQNKIEKYKKEAEKSWENTKEYKEFEEKDKSRTKEQNRILNAKLMNIIAEFGKMKNLSPESEMVQNQVKKLQDFISENYYKCSEEILNGLGIMYVSDKEFSENIEKAAGAGAAQFISDAIKAYCKKIK